MRCVGFVSAVLLATVASVAFVGVYGQVTLVNPYSAIVGVTITGTGANLLYNKAAAGYLRLLNSGSSASNQFHIDSQSAALGNSSAYVSIWPVTCSSCCTNGQTCLQATSLQMPITAQTVALQMSVLGCGSNVFSVSNPGQPWKMWGFYNVWGGVESTAPNTAVVGFCDSGMPSNNEVFQFFNYNPTTGTFQILANDQNQSGQMCVQANIATGGQTASLVLEPCQLLDTQVFQLYGINIPTTLPVTTFLPGGTLTQAVLYNVGQSGVVVGGLQKQTSGGLKLATYTIVDIGTGLSNSQARVQLLEATCPSSTSSAYCTQQSSFSSILPIAVNFPNTACSSGTAYMNIWGGIGSTVNGESVVNFCDSGIANNEVFLFLPTSRANIYQLQAYNTANGKFCLQAMDHADETMQLSPCDATNANQLFGFLAPQ